MHEESEKGSVPTENSRAKEDKPTGTADAPEPVAASEAAVQPDDGPDEAPDADEAPEAPEAEHKTDDGTEPPEEGTVAEDAGSSPEDAPVDIPTPEFTIESLSSALEEARGQLVTLGREHERNAATLLDTQARLRAVSKAYREQQEEMEGFRKRLETQARYKLERQAFDAVAAFLDPVMNLRRSVENAEGLPDALLQGLQMVESQFSDAMTRLGLEPVPGVGAPFDPNVHEALAVAPVTDAEQDGKVLVVHAEGFMVAGKILEASKVVIGKYTAEALEEA